MNKYIHGHCQPALTKINEINVSRFFSSFSNLHYHSDGITVRYVPDITDESLTIEPSICDKLPATLNKQRAHTLDTPISLANLWLATSSAEITGLLR